ncbi:MAG: serine protease [Chloroflexota bacterium]|nr:serine protease [Chloroflexota bacterium]
MPTPTPPLPTPTPTPPPPSDRLAETDYPPPMVIPPLPAPQVPSQAQPLADVLVSVAVHRPMNYERPANYGIYASRSDGLVVSPDGLVLTVLDYSEPIGRIEVQTPGRGSFDGTIERADPITGATLLKTGASGLPFATLKAGATESNGEPVVLLGRDPNTINLVHAGYAGLARSYTSPDTPFFTLLPIGHMGVEGSVVVNRDGEFLGMSGLWPWYGTGPAPTGGPPPGPARPAVKASALLALLQGRLAQGADSIPAAVSYHGNDGRGWSASADWPAPGESLEGPAGDAMRSVGGLADVGSLDGWAYNVLGYKPGTALEFAYAQPQELRSADGKLLGEARYVAFWWSREGGQPDVVLCGTEPGRFGGAFVAGDLEPLRVAVKSAMNATSSAPSVPALPGYYSFDYPVKMTVASEKETYHSGEVVRFVVAVENLIDWPMPLYNLPPAIEVRNQARGGPWWQSQAGSQSQTIAPHDALTMDVVWPQLDSKGNVAPPGDYCVTTYWRTARDGVVGHGGPKACFTLLP